jgi:hypothetical protein
LVAISGANPGQAADTIVFQRECTSPSSPKPKLNPESATQVLRPFLKKMFYALIMTAILASYTVLIAQFSTVSIYHIFPF